MNIENIKKDILKLDLSKWNLFRVSGMLMFDNCPIKYEYKPKFKWT